jgi:hypothetical protein
MPVNEESAASRRFEASAFGSRTITMCVTSDGLTCGQRPDDVLSFSDAQLGRWTLYRSTTVGTALHLQRETAAQGASAPYSPRLSSFLGVDPHRFVLGGRDHRIATGTRLEAPPVDSVDAWLWASDFDELLTTVDRRCGLDVSRPAPGEPTRCLLISNSGFDALNPKPSLAIDVGADAISVIDPNTNAPIASASLAQVTATPANYTRSGSFPARFKISVPVLLVRGPGLQPLSIGCPDGPGLRGPSFSWRGDGEYRFSWRDKVQREDATPYWVSGADWLALVEKFGLTSQLEDKARR